MPTFWTTGLGGVVGRRGPGRGPGRRRVWRTVLALAPRADSVPDVLRQAGAGKKRRYEAEWDGRPYAFVVYRRHKKGQDAAAIAVVEAPRVHAARVSEPLPAVAQAAVRRARTIDELHAVVIALVIAEVI